MIYEVEVSEVYQLMRDGILQVANMQSIFPSITKFGMAALLPHKELTAEVRNDIGNCR